MGSFEDALRRLSRLDAQAEASAPASAPASLAPAVLQGAAFTKGDRARDLVTGEEVTVEHSRFVHAVFPTPSR